MFGGAKPWAERRVKPKPCKACQRVFQPVSGGNTYCPPCAPAQARKRRSETNKAYRLANREKHLTRRADYELRTLYGMTFAEYRRKLEEQGGRCAICRTDNPSGKGVVRRFAVDHCHATGDVRGLLCHRCNGALGMVGDNRETLQRMIDYLREHTL